MRAPHLLHKPPSYYYGRFGVSWPGLLVTVMFFAFGLTMLLQPGRYNNTPSYANLIQIAGLTTWGVAYLIASLMMASFFAYFRSEWFAVAAHSFAFMLSAVWLGAFVVRYATDDGTTIVNVCSWTAFTILILHSSLRINATISGPDGRGRE
jgi:hypothetical protein